MCLTLVSYRFDGTIALAQSIIIINQTDLIGLYFLGGENCSKSKDHPKSSYVGGSISQFQPGR
jgi:hypothetical protein